MNNSLLKCLLMACIIIPISSWGMLGHEDNGDPNRQEPNICDLSEEESEEEEDSTEIVDRLLPEFRTAFQNIPTTNASEIREQIREQIEPMRISENRGEPIGNDLTDKVLISCLFIIMSEDSTLPGLSQEELENPSSVANYIMNPNNWSRIRNQLPNIVAAVDIND